MPSLAGESSVKVKQIRSKASTGWQKAGGGAGLDELANSPESGVGVPYEK